MIKFIKKFFNNPDKENIELIRKSKYFDEKYYLTENPDIKGDSCSHYYYYGWKEGKSPSFIFSNDAYLQRYKDVTQANINPLLHYLKFGKAENRIIEKDNGLSLKKIYEKLYKCPYFYKIYVNSKEEKRVNLFFDEVSDKVSELHNLINFVVEFCKKKNYELRIIYSIMDFESFKEMLDKYNIIIPDKTIFLNLKSSNYLEVGLNDIYIATSWKNALALINTSSIDSNIYYYLPHNILDLSSEEYYYISCICTNNSITILTEDKNDIKKIGKCKLNFLNSEKRIGKKAIRKIYCDFNKMFIAGIVLLNEGFLEGLFGNKVSNIYILDNINNYKFHLDTEVTVKSVKDLAPTDLIIKFLDTNENINYDCPYIKISLEKKDFSCNNYILINDKNSYEYLTKNKDYSKEKIDYNFEDFRDCINRLKDKE